jgi:hypothetical protein
MSVESTTQALCDLALRFGEGDEESMVRALLLLCFISTYWFAMHIEGPENCSCMLNLVLDTLPDSRPLEVHSGPHKSCRG